MPEIPLTLDLSAVAIFALTGALVASRAQLDLVGFLFLATLTAVGGGSVRDLLLGLPVFWVSAPINLGIVCGAALVVFGTAHLMESRYRVLIWLDAAALSVAVAAGVSAAEGAGSPAAITVVMGVATGCLGGLMRDVVANEVPLVLKQGELYASAAFTGALCGVAALRLGLPPSLPLALCIVVTFGLRAGAIAWGWHLPVYKGRPPRPR